MQMETVTWATSGWSQPLPTALDSDHTLVVVFGDRQVDSEPIDELRRAFPRARVVGCSTAGQIMGDQVTDGTLSVGVVQFASTRIAEAVTDIAGPADSYDAGQRIGAALAAPDLRAVFVLSDGMMVNGSELVRGIESRVSPGTLVTGGMAGDGDRFEHTWVITRDGLRPGNVAAVGLMGDDVVVGSGSFGGWDPFGPERLITRAKGNVLYELDGQPALALYKQYLGDRADGLPATGLRFPLAVRATRDDADRTVRGVLAVDEAEQSMTFAGDVPEGWQAQLMYANKDRLVEGAMRAASMAESAAGPCLAIAISCVARRLVLGERVEDEIDATLEALGSGADRRLIGFYSYGEIAPHASGSCELHNQTMTITTISER